MAKMTRMADSFTNALQRAWSRRESLGFGAWEALRIFHGAAEAPEGYEEIAIERFGSHLWVTSWEKVGQKPLPTAELQRWAESQGFQSAVELHRPKGDVPTPPRVLFGEPEATRFSVTEQGMRFWVQLLGSRHPGLFLDHAPLRSWLARHSEGRRVLNLFAYTGALSVASARGGARALTTVDLSQSTLSWAKQNWALNELPESKSEWIAGDALEELPRLKRKGRLFDGIILDPPSFSRGKKSTFSTAKDLKRLHRLVLDVLAPGGWLATSINSQGISASEFEREIVLAAREGGDKLLFLKSLEAPESFPAALGQGFKRALKGFILLKLAAPSE
jgi:23S rRNA (cytosine1962-C5)-methyltransferase